MATDPALVAHRTWLGYIQPVGLVVSAPALVSAQCTLPLDAAARQAALATVTSHGRIVDLPSFLRVMLDWQEGDLVPGDTLPDLTVPLPEYGDILAPSFAVPKPDGETGFQMLVVSLPDDTNLDEMPPEGSPGWRATPQARMERLLREREVPIGLLCTPNTIRLVYAPRGESSGHLTWSIADLGTVAGRPLLGSLVMLLHAERLFVVPPNKRLPAVLKDSRKYQNDVSTRLAEQVLGALDDLLRGFEMADADRNGDLLRQVVDTDPQHVYGGLITVLLRLVFLLYAEERGLMSGDPVYVRHYSVAGLFDKLREDAGRHPDTMDQRYGAWARLLSLFRFVWEGGGDERLSLPGRRGSLFDPGIYAFLEGRAYRQAAVGALPVVVPRVPDGVIWRVLEKLLVLDGERLSYRALDVEQIGSVYEAMMGFELRRAYAPSLAVRPKRIVVSTKAVLDAKGAARAKILKEEAQCDVTGKALEALKAATTPEELAAALSKKVVDGRVLPEGSLYLQPGEERRRSGSHYTPRSLTEPIVRTTLRPVIEALGERPRPEAVLALKVCDPAMGSGAFLVEACRQLADAVMEAWSVHRCLPEIPADEDPVLHARRLVAQRCLYGVDKNIFAVNLAKLSLWLVTLAKDHPFTFLDHALKHGDSLVGLTRRQIGRFDWSEDDAEAPPLIAFIESAAANARVHRGEIFAASDDEDEKKHLAWREAEDDLDPARGMGDLCVWSFFSADDTKGRAKRRDELKALVGRWRAGDAQAAVQVMHECERMRGGERPVVPFHWEVEFPEVFERGGFDGVVGNPPFLGGLRITGASGLPYQQWLMERHGSSGLTDLVAYFFRKAFGLLRSDACLGLIATNSIAQGDTRTAGLTAICLSGGCIYSAQRNLKWPGLAAVSVCVIHIGKGFSIVPQLDGKPVSRISAFLSVGKVDENPKVLRSNIGRAAIGSYLLGIGFVFEDDNPNATPLAHMRRLLEDNSENQEVIRGLLGGEELNNSPTISPRRYVIDFGERSESEARAFLDLFSIVEEKVKPARASVAQRDRRELWWLHATRSPELRKFLVERSRFFALSQVSSHLALAAVPRDVTVPHTVVAFLFDGSADFCVLQARPHEIWARFFGSSMKNDLRYTPSDCFETFPFPTKWDSDSALEAAGRTYYDHRAAFMVQNEQGLTTTYNRFHDPDERDPGIVRLRELHDAMDRAVLDAYGWQDIQPRCEFLLDWEEPEDEEDEETSKKSRKKKPWRYRWPDDIRDEVLARLLALNQQRAEEERKLAPPKESGKKPKKEKPKAPAKPRAKREKAQPAGLFDAPEGES